MVNTESGLPELFENVVNVWFFKTQCMDFNWWSYTLHPLGYGTLQRDCLLVSWMVGARALRWECTFRLGCVAAGT